VYLLPSLFTVANLFCGFSAIIQASNGQFVIAAVLILVATVLDGLDGRIARLTGSASEFGLQLDSIADTVSFGVAPAYLMYVWGVEPLNRMGWALSFLYAICAAVRLARFNIQHTVSDNRFFIGLPTPPAAIVLASTVLYFHAPVPGTFGVLLAAGLLLIISLLMVSRIRYRSFKDIDLRSRRSYLAIVPMAFVLVGILIDPPLVILILAFLYLVSGPLSLVAPRRSKSAVHGPASPLLRGRGASPDAVERPISEL
jgi:CDP-diacylglycerol--serine O-phosphatidyltransferase